VLIYTYMEPKLSQRELLIALLNQASNPFTSSEKIADIREVLGTGTTFKGVNHLYLARCCFIDHPLFPVSIKEAKEQALLAIKEGNNNGYYYLYLTCKNEDAQKAKEYLLLGIKANYSYAFLEYAKLLKAGQLFNRNIDLSYKYFELASKELPLEGFFGMLLIDEEKHDIKKANEDYQRALDLGINLPGVVR